MWISEKGNQRRFVLTLIVIGCLAPWLVRTSEQSIKTMFNGPPVWIPEDIEYRRDYDWFKRVFEERDPVVLYFDNCTIDNERLDLFSNELFFSDDPQEAERRAELFQFAISGRDLLRELQGDEIDLSPQSAVARLKGSFIGPDGKSTCILVMLTEKGVYARGEAIALIRQTALPFFSIESNELALVGTAVDGATIDEESLKSISKFLLPSMIVASLLCWWCIRSLLFTAIIFTVAIVGQGLVLSLATFSGNPMNAIVIVVPALVFVLTVSAGVHLANYHREAMNERRKIRDASVATTTQLAIRHGMVPCLLATLTTIIGTASLLVSQMIPITDFSLLASVGVAITTWLLFALLPYGMDLRARWLVRHTGATADRYSGNSLSQSPSTGLFAKRLVKLISRSPGVVIAAFVIAMFVLAIGSLSLESSVNIRELVTEDSRLLHDYRRYETKIGPIVPVDILISFPYPNDTKLLHRFEFVRDMHVIVNQMDEVGSTMSAATFFPAVPSGGGIRRTIIRSTLEAKLKEAIPRFVEGHQYATDDGREYWRITARLSAIDDTDYGQFLDVLRHRLDPFLDEQGIGVEAKYTGALPVTYQAQRALLDDLFQSYLAAFSLIAVVMMVTLRGLWAGLVIMLPNLFPTLLLFGSMGWMGVPVNIGSVMTASVALGIAVDDTLHFLICYRRETFAGGDPQASVAKCLSQCGRAMFHTSLIVGLGLAFFCQSEFVPTQRFAMMMIGLIAAALLGDIILLPALLLSRLGRVFLQVRRS
jgi:predicted RND superfamily exporter protein